MNASCILRNSVPDPHYLNADPARAKIRGSGSETLHNLLIFYDTGEEDQGESLESRMHDMELTIDRAMLVCGATFDQDLLLRVNQSKSYA